MQKTYNIGNIKRITNFDIDYVMWNMRGKYNYTYVYDEDFRLDWSEGYFSPHNLPDKTYNLTMQYSSSGNITKKTLSASTHINGSNSSLSYSNHYIYDNGHKPHAVRQTPQAEYGWDLNGNMKYRRNEEGDRFMSWDEENRLASVRDVGAISQASVYMYGADGERVWKFAGYETQMQVNAQTVYSNIQFRKTLYVSPLMVMTEGDYTKHYYIEGERVCSKLGGGFGLVSDLPAAQNSHLTALVDDLSSIGHGLGKIVDSSLYRVQYHGNWDINTELQSAYNLNNDLEEKQFFYHSDHLGSSSFITSTEGYAVQHLQYLPFGEIFVSQRNDWFDSRYKFTAKEHDNETN